MPPVGVTPKTRSMMRFLAIDPEIFPLMGVLVTIFTGVGYMVGRKATNVNSEGSIRIASSQPFPWHQQHRNGKEKEAEGETSNGNYKYRFHKNADLNEQILEAPGAITEHKVRVKLPKETKENLPKGVNLD